MASIMKLYNSYLAPTNDAGLSLGQITARWNQLFVATGATIASITIDDHIDLVDTYIQSITYLYGATNNTFIDLHTDGRILIQALGAGSPYATPDIDITGSMYIREDSGFYSTSRLMFRDATIYMYSGTADHLDLVAPVSIDLNAPAVIGTGTCSFLGYKMAVRSAAVTDTILPNDDVLRYTGTFTATLPASTGLGKMYWIKNLGTGTITVAATGSDVIDGAVSIESSVQYGKVQLVDGAAGYWDILVQEEFTVS